MEHSRRLVYGLVTVTTAIALGGCAGMSARDRNMITGASVGAVAGTILTGGSPVGTIGGAAVGGVIGNEIGRRK